MVMGNWCWNPKLGFAKRIFLKQKLFYVHVLLSIGRRVPPVGAFGLQEATIQALHPMPNVGKS